jgi:lambda repressor-like predicted transcriptional regulator
MLDVELTDGLFDRLSVLMRREGLSCRGLSIKAGFKGHYLRNVRKQFKAGQQHNIPWDKLEKIARAIKVSPEYLAGGADEELVALAYEMLGHLPPNAVGQEWRHTVAGAIADSSRSTVTISAMPHRASAKVRSRGNVASCGPAW